MFKSTSGAKLRKIAEEKNAAVGFDGPSAESYDAQAGVPRGTPAGQGTYACNVKNTLVQTPIPSKSVKDAFKSTKG